MSVHQLSHHWPTIPTPTPNTNPWGGPSTGHFKIHITNKAIRKSSSLHSHFQFAIFAIWEYYPLGNTVIPYWIEHHHFKNCLHQAISKMVHLQNRKVLTRVSSNFISFSIHIQNIKSFFGMKNWRVSLLKRSKWNTLTLSKGLLSSCFLNKTLLELYIPCNALLLMKWIIFLMKMKWFSFLLKKERKKRHSKILHQIKLKDNYLWTQGKQSKSASVEHKGVFSLDTHPVWKILAPNSWSSAKL